MKQINVTETMEDVDTDKKPEKENDKVDKIDNKENKGPATKKPNMTKKKAVSETDEDETEEAKELKIINKMLKFMQEDVEENLRVAKENRDTVDDKRKAAREKIRKLRVEMNAFFNKLEQTLDKTIEQTRSDDLQKMMILTSECQTLADKIKGLTDDIGKSLKDKKPCGQICNMNKVRQDMKDFDTTIRRVCQDNHVQEYVFERSSDIVNMFKTITELGYLNCDVEKKKTVLKYSEVDINAKAENEKLIPLLAGMTFVSDDQLVATDYENRCIKLINTKTHQLDCKFPVSSEPWDVTSTKSGQIAVTLPMKNRIQYLTVQNSSISMGKDFSTNGECRGIDCKLKQLFVTYVSPGKVEILDMKGTVLKCFASTNSETGLFKWPGYISVTTEPKQWIYVTDKERDTVTRMTYDGQIDESFFGQSMKGPRGVAIDDKGCVFVCGRNSNTLCQILFKTKSVEKLLQRSDGLKQPHCLMWHMNRVYISTCGGQFLRSWEVV